MNKYCTNCGNKINENADICIKCGKFVSKVPNNNRKVNLEEIFSIVGMVFGILGFITILLMSFALSEARQDLINEEIYLKLFMAMFFCIIPLAPTLPGLILSIIGEKKKKSIYGTVGLIASILSTLFIIASFIYLVW